MGVLVSGKPRLSKSRTGSSILSTPAIIKLSEIFAVFCSAICKNRQCFCSSKRIIIFSNPPLRPPAGRQAGNTKLPRKLQKMPKSSII